MIVLKYSKMGLYVSGVDGLNLKFTPLLSQAKQFEEPENYNNEELIENHPQLFFYLQLAKSQNKRLDMEDYVQE